MLSTLFIKRYRTQKLTKKIKALKEIERKEKQRGVKEKHQLPNFRAKDIAATFGAEFAANPRPETAIGLIRFGTDVYCYCYFLRYRCVSLSIALFTTENLGQKLFGWACLCWEMLNKQIRILNKAVTIFLKSVHLCITRGSMFTDREKTNGSAVNHYN